MASTGPSPDDRGWARELRRHHEGACVIGERAFPVRFVLDPGTGMLVMPVEGWVLDHAECVLFLPDERADALQVMVELSPGIEGALEDRWQAYHGVSRLRAWVRGRPAGARRESEVSEGDVRAANELRAHEARLVRLCNERRAALSQACRRLAGVEVDEACCVGVDEYGLDVRARFGIVRAEFPREEASGGVGVTCPDRAAEIIRRLLGGA